MQVVPELDLLSTITSPVKQLASIPKKEQGEAGRLLVSVLVSARAQRLTSMRIKHEQIVQVEAAPVLLCIICLPPEDDPSKRR